MIKERFYKLASIILVFFLIVMAIVVLVSGYFKNSTPQRIYSKSLTCVVELKAISQNFGESYGTAVFINENGELITNAHIVTYTQSGEQHLFDKYEIRFATEEEYREVVLIRYDKEFDLALLKVKDDCHFSFVTLGNSSSLKAGDKVYAIGNGLNYGISITQGIVSIPLLEIEYGNILKEVVQCELLINEGNSGGALFDERGRLVGITTFRIRDKEGNIIYGLAYCVPVNLVTVFLGNDN